MMKNTAKTALGAMCMALGVAFMLLSSLVPFCEYAVPAAAAIIILFMNIETDWKWSLGVYIGTSLISAFVVPQKEAAGMYIALFGYYPIIMPLLNKLKKVLSYVLKIVYFNAVTVAAYYILINVIGISSDFMDDLSKYTLPVLLACGTVAFLLYDRALLLFEKQYMIKWHKRFKKIFKIK